MDITQFSQINPPQRLLMGPGPINVDPRVLRAMASQLVGQYDPAMTHYMNEVMALYRGVFRTENRWTMLVDGTSRAGIEAILVSAIRPGDKVLVPVFGRFGHLLCEIARRCRAEVHTIEVPWGKSLPRTRLKTRSSACARACCSPCRAIPRPPCRSRWRSWERFVVATMCCSIPTPPRRSAATCWKPTPGSWTRCPPGCRSAWRPLRHLAHHPQPTDGRGHPPPPLH